MPKVDLGSTTSLLASPVQAQKGHTRDVKPFAKVLSSLDAVEKRGQTSAEPIGDPAEAITNERPPASQAENAGDDEIRAADADREAIPAQDEPRQAQDCAPRDDVRSSEAAAEEPGPSAERVLPETKGESGSDQAGVAAIGGGAIPQLPPVPSKDLATASVPAPGVAEPQAAEQGKQRAQKAIAEAAPEVKEVAGEPIDAKQASSISTRGERGQAHDASPEPRAGSSTVATKAANGQGPVETGVVAGQDSSSLVKDAARDAVDSKLTPAPQQALETPVEPIDQADDNKSSEPLHRRQAARTKAATSLVIRPVSTSTDLFRTEELGPAHPQAGIAPATEQVQPGNQQRNDDHRQDADQKLQPAQPHQATALHHPTPSTSVPVAQATTASAQPTPAPGSSQKIGVSNSIGSLVAPLSGAQVKQMALDRLTAQAPLLKQGIEQASFIPQAAKGLAMALKQSDGTITLKLTPGHLGALKIEVTLQGTEVAARLEPSTESARQLLIDSQSSLRAALEARGLSVERIEVTAPQSAPAQDARDQRNPGHHQDQPGAGFAGQGDAGRHAGRDAESFPGQQGKAIGHQFDTSGGSDEPRPMTQDPTITLTLDNGGTYRIHLDAVA